MNAEFELLDGEDVEAGGAGGVPAPEADQLTDAEVAAVLAGRDDAGTARDAGAN